MLNTSIDRQRMKRTFLSNIRLQAYSAVILLCPFVSLPEDYKIGKRNILNLLFVKLGWFWTTVLLLPMIFSGIRSNDREGVARSIFRVILGSFLWFISVNTFEILDALTGFDISGHTFLLIFSNLLISSELELSKGARFSARCLEEGDNLLSEKHQQKVTMAAKALTFLWDFMFIQTALYYHTFIQKFIAAIWAFSAWYLMHVTFYHQTAKPETIRKSN